MSNLNFKDNRPVHVKTWHLEKSWDLVIFALIFSEFGYVPDYFYVPNFFYVFKSLCSKKHKYFFWHLEKLSVFKFLCSKKYKYFFWHLEKPSVFKFLCSKKHKYIFWHLEKSFLPWFFKKSLGHRKNLEHSQIQKKSRQIWLSPNLTLRKKLGLCRFCLDFSKRHRKSLENRKNLQLSQIQIKSKQKHFSMLKFLDGQAW